MPLLRMYEDDDYRPEYSTLMIRDHWNHDLEIEPRPELEALSEHADHAQPCGTIARAGDGWLRAIARDADHLVRLEVHDAVPPDDIADWDDVVETPYHCGVGSIVLDTLIPGDGSNLVPLELGPPGFYRARVSRKCAQPEVVGFQAEEGDVWRLQFWPAHGTSELPHWMARSESVVMGEDDGWGDILQCVGGDVLSAARVASTVHAEGATADAIDARFGVQGGPTGRLDQPLWKAPPSPLPTGHVDLDEHEAENHRSVLARAADERGELAEFAGQLGVPAPGTRRDLLPFLVAAGVLTVNDSSGTTRYRAVAKPPRAETVLRLPAERVSRMRRQEAFNRYTSLAADIVSVAQWSPGYTATADVSALAERLLAPPDEIQGALRYAEEENLVSVDGIRLTALPRNDEEDIYSVPQPMPQTGGPPWETDDPSREEDLGWEDVDTAWAEYDSTAGVTSDEMPEGMYLTIAQWSGPSARSSYRPPHGEPARAGFISGEGDLVVWREGKPFKLARAPGESVDRAIETAYGIVMHRMAHETVLVRPDGRVEKLADEPGHGLALGENGRHLVLTESRHSRRSARHRLLLIDLADSSTTTLPWPEDRQIYVTALHHGAIYLSTDDESMRWIPGAEPEALPYRPRQIDPLSGAILAYGDEPGELVILPDGTLRQIRVSSAEGLVPGGTALYAFRYEPPAVTIFGLETGSSDPQVFWLPLGSETSTTIPGHPVWEDPNHLLFTVPNGDFDVVRLDVRTGEFEEVPLGNDPGYRPMLVEPLLTGRAPSS